MRISFDQFLFMVLDPSARFLAHCKTFIKNSLYKCKIKVSNEKWLSKSLAGQYLSEFQNKAQMLACKNKRKLTLQFS